MIVTLTWPEQLFAAQAGAMRAISAMQVKRTEPYGCPKADQWAVNIEGAGAEAAVAKALGKYWESVAPAGKLLHQLPGDVGCLQVRSTTHKDGRLIVHDRDLDNAQFVLARGTFPRWELAGWMTGGEAKQKKFWREMKRPAYFVPAEELHPMEQLL